MTKRELIAYLSDRLGLTQKVVREMLAELERLSQRQLKKAGEFEIPGVLRLVLSRRKAREGRNAFTGEPIRIPAKIALRARVSQHLNAALVPAGERTSLRQPFTARKGGKAKGGFRGARRPVRREVWRTAKKAAKGAGVAGLWQGRRRGGEPRLSDSEIVRVFYGTDRRPSAAKGDGHFTTRRGDGLSIGWCDVSIPPDHRMAVVERPRVLRLEFREDRRRHLVIIQREAQTAHRFWASIRALTPSEALLFIHGYSVVFDDAVYRAAQLAYDLEFHGVAMLYSWTSSGSRWRYTADVANNEFTVDTLKRFLLRVVEKTGVRAVHVVAHSMGNRALLHALAQLSERWRERRLPRIRNLFLTAPDIDRGVFLQLAEAMSRTSTRSTLYASSRDKALKASKALQSYPRAGDATDIVIVEGIDSIDATRLETDFLGHSYYGDNVSVISDFYSVLRHGHPPSARFGLRGIPRNSPQYWEFRPSR